MENELSDSVSLAIEAWRARQPEQERLARELFRDEVDGEFVDVPIEGNGE